MKPATTSLADRLVQARTDKGMSQEDVARHAGMTQQSYSDLERGISKRTTRIGSLSRVLNVDAYWLETGNGAAVIGVGEESALYFAASESDRNLIDVAIKLSEEKKHALLKLLT